MKPTSGDGDNESVERAQGNVGLDYLFLAYSGGWALPSAMLAAGLSSRWLVALALIINVVAGLYWGWYCLKAEYFIHRMMFIRAGSDTETATPSIFTILTVYISVLAASLTLQFLLYAALRAAFRSLLQ